MPKRKVVIHTDGSSLSNLSSGYGAIITCGQHEMLLSEHLGKKSNNHAELAGVVRALEQLTESCEVVVVSDSRYVTDNFHRSLKRWKKNGWQTRTQQTVSNKHLWERLDQVSRSHDVRMEHVDGHSGHPQNEQCDKMAKRAAKKQ